MRAHLRASTLLTCAFAALSLLACGDGGAGSESKVSHEEIASLVGAGSASAPGSCSVASCHGSAAEAELSFKGGEDLRTLLVGVPSCEAPEMNLVEPGQPERSWLWIKLTAPISSEITGDLKPDPSWGTAGKGCGANGFGKRMPRVAPYTLSADELAKIRAWIEAGAPGDGEN